MTNEFDAKARGWDNEQRHIDRTQAIAAEMKNQIPFKPGMKVLEYGAGTGLLSFELKDFFQEIVLMDNSKEMIRVCEEKCLYHKTPHIKPLLFDLEHHDYPGKFDMIYNQMVLHHVHEVDLLLGKFSAMLNPGGILAIADLYSEDGSFHDTDSNVHKGFDPERLLDELESKGFNRGRYTHCYNLKRPNGREYPVFLLWAERSC